jgi:hypothetical protein
VLLDQEAGDGAGARLDLALRPAAVGAIGRVGQIDQVRAWKQPAYLAQDGQAADAGVEYADWRE